MRFVPVKSKEQQGLLSLHRARDVLVRQRTQTINVLRSLAAEFGVIAAKGKLPFSQLEALILDEADGRLPQAARLALKPLMDQIQSLLRHIVLLEREIVGRARKDEANARLQTIPGVGPITASALLATLGNPSRFAKARDLAAWIGLTPKAHASGGKARRSAISKQGDPYLRRLLVQGASAVIRTARKPNSKASAWLKTVLLKLPPKVALIALANKTARIVWAILVKGGVYGHSQTVAP